MVVGCTDDNRAPRPSSASSSSSSLSSLSSSLPSASASTSSSSSFIHSFIHFRYLYSAPSRFLLRGAPDYSADTESEFHAEAHEQLRAKDLPRVPTRRLEVDSNPQPSGCKAPNIPLHHRVPQIGRASCRERVEIAA